MQYDQQFYKQNITLLIQICREKIQILFVTNT